MKKRRPRKLQIRLSIEEYDQLEKLDQELGRIGNNINQLAKASNIAINRGQVPRIAPEALFELKEMLTLS